MSQYQDPQGRKPGDPAKMRPIAMKFYDKFVQDYIIIKCLRDPVTKKPAYLVQHAHKAPGDKPWAKIIPVYAFEPKEN